MLDLIAEGEVVGTTCGLRTFRRLLLATAEAKKAQQKAARLAKRLRRAAAAVHAESSAHAAKVGSTCLLILQLPSQSHLLLSPNTSVKGKNFVELCPFAAGSRDPCEV